MDKRSGPRQTLCIEQVERTTYGISLSFEVTDRVDGYERVRNAVEVEAPGGKCLAGGDFIPEGGFLSRKGELFDFPIGITKSEASTINDGKEELTRH